MSFEESEYFHILIACALSCTSSRFLTGLQQTVQISLQLHIYISKIEHRCALCLLLLLLDNFIILFLRMERARRFQETRKMSSE